jgi:para-aminobenzoate synthetase / 4-amino-4-deoxychorismate lyase
MLVTSAALADRKEAPTAELWRVRLPWTCGPELVLAALADEPCLACLSGVWAGGGTIIVAEPLRIAESGADPFALLDDLPRINAGPAESLGAVGGGWFGWLGYRLAARVEDVPLVQQRPAPLPDFHLAYYDHVLHQDAYGFWWFEALATRERSAELEERLEYLRRRVADQRFGGATPSHPGPSPLRLHRDVAQHHLHAVAECRERIAAGEIFQANICQRLDGEYTGTANELLRSALIGGRVPQYTAAFDTPAGGIVSLSPELFLRRQGRHVRSGPIKGTVHRPNDPERAVLSLQQLQSSAKDAAEHVMIVDLMRNDIGRVCEYGSVSAPRRPTAEAHPGLWHLVTTVEGRLRHGVGDGELLRAAFPPGSVTGAPKVQALKVIAELEPTGREVYTGAIGYASPLAGLELNVAIRTLELADGKLWLGVGGGIVADSDPQAELEETLVKARPVAAAIGTTVVSE